MKDNKKLLIGLLVALGVLVSIFAVVLVTSGRDGVTEETLPEGAPVVRSANIADITSLTLSGVEDSKTFEYTDNGWVYNSIEDFPLDPEALNRALESVSLIRAERVAAEGVTDLSPYGLDEPQMRVSYVTDGEYEFLIGDYSSEDEGHYLCEKGSDTVFIVGGELPQLCASDESDFVKSGALPENYTEGTVKRVSVNGVDYAEAYPAFSQLAEEVLAISLEECVSYRADEDDLSGAVSAEVCYSAPTEYGTAAFTLPLKLKKEGGYILFTQGEDPILYRLECERYPKLSELL